MDINGILGGARDAITVQRVFGEAYEQDGTLVVPVARVSGGGGGGVGGSKDDADETQGSGGGFGIRAEPAGAYVIREGSVRWEPAVDVNRIVFGGQLVALGLLLLLRTAIKQHGKGKGKGKARHKAKAKDKAKGRDKTKAKG